jgi:hypothetical protein
MKAKTRAVVIAAAAIATTALYGNIRFSLSRYEPLCEQLPGVSCYGKAPVVAGFEDKSVSYLSNGKEAVLSLTYGEGWKHKEMVVRAAYKEGERLPFSIATSTGLRAHGRAYEAPAQVVAGVLDRPVIKGECGWRGAYLGILEIFHTPAPLKFEDASAGLSPLPATHRNPSKAYAEAKGIFDTLRILSQKTQGYDRWRVCKQGRMLADELEKRHGPRDYYDVAEASTLINEIAACKVPEAPKPFWRGWDALFGLGLLGIFALTVRGCFKRERRQAVPLESAPQGKAEDGDMEKEKFELLRREYIDAMQDLADRIRKAKSFAEVKNLEDEFIDLTEKIDAEEKTLVEALRFSMGRVIDIIQMRREDLGGKIRWD